MTHTAENNELLKNMLEEAGFQDGKAVCIIDCDAEPLCPLELEVEEHHGGGRLKWRHDKVAIHVFEEQVKAGGLKGDDLREKLEGMHALNANVLDYLLERPALIPDSWKTKKVFFWGTEYSDSDGDPVVRFLVWRDDEW